MRSFQYHRSHAPDEAISAALAMEPGRGVPPQQAPGQFLAGGTTILDLMKLDVMQPAELVDINPLQRSELGRITVGDRGLALGALVRMAQAADHPMIRRDYPVIAQSLTFAASQQLRNMASLAGNVLQRTRCPYFRDTAFACNKRQPGSGCSALGGVNRIHAVLGTSEHCIATYAGDFAQALIALDAEVTVAGLDGEKRMAFADLHRPPGSTPHVETVLAPGELITGFIVPAGPWTRRSQYLKVRDRESYAFALASAAVALDMDGDTVRQARVALGGVATVPWRATAAEAALQGARLDEAAAQRAADAAFADAKTHEHNAYKVLLGKRTLVRALLDTARMEA